MGTYLHIPEPCHENWAAMTPTERGRHCAVCDKVVRDFVGVPKDEIVAELTRIGDGICTRVDASAVAPPLPVVAAIRFSTAHIRQFLLAFVLAFGLEIWGVSPLAAQTVQPQFSRLRLPENMKVALDAHHGRDVVLRGRVVDIYSDETVQYAHVMAYEGGKLLCGTLTDTLGYFSLRFPKSALVGESYQLRLKYMGREREDREIAMDVRDFLYLIDASEMLKGITIEGRNSLWRELGGTTIMGGGIGPDRRYLMTAGTYRSAVGDPLYRPLDEWLMMNSSEIHHSGRW